MYKLVQKQTYTFLSHRYGIILIFLGLVFIIISAFHFGESSLEWSRDQYSQMFNVYHDNIAGKAFQNRMCLPIPIDAVYTWVNGSDPKLKADLQRVKVKVEKEIAKSTSKPGDTDAIHCNHENCIPGHILVFSSILPGKVEKSDLALTHLEFLEASRLFNVSKSAQANMTIAQFKNQADVNAIMKAKPNVVVMGKNISLSKGYLTSDWQAEGNVELKDVVFVSNVGKDVTEEELRKKIPEDQRDNVRFIDLTTSAGVAIITLKTVEVTKTFITEFEKSEGDVGMKVGEAYLLWGLEKTESSQDEDVSSSRFEDNEEMRYSLRSLEQNAPWIRHVYIVTNGQIPSWLNLDNQRISIVTHEEIFPNKTHLPTFSSPAIESNLHRIPGLSKKFIYLNDDTMFGKPVWPDDFYTHSRGQKVYLTWPVPNCAEGCPPSWILDNYCDAACNNSECDWDGGDCSGTPKSGVGGIAADGGAALDFTGMYCNGGCANGWIADRYCDQTCNVAACGFDAGDCGTANFHKLYRVDIKGPANITVPQGVKVLYVNITHIFGENVTILEAQYEDSKVIRTATVAQKFKLITLLLHSNISDTLIGFSLDGQRADNTPVSVKFNLTVNTLPVSERGLVVARKDEDSKEVENEDENKNEDETIQDIFHDIDESKRAPKIPEFLNPLVDLQDADFENPSEAVAEKLAELEKKLADGDITEKGLKRLKAQLLQDLAQSPKYVDDSPKKPDGLKDNFKGGRLEDSFKRTRLGKKDSKKPLQDPQEEDHAPKEEQDDGISLNQKVQDKAMRKIGFNHREKIQRVDADLSLNLQGQRMGQLPEGELTKKEPEPNHIEPGFKEQKLHETKQKVEGESIEALRDELRQLQKQQAESRIPAQGQSPGNFAQQNVIKQELPLQQPNQQQPNHRQPIYYQRQQNQHQQIHWPQINQHQPISEQQQQGGQQQLQQLRVRPQEQFPNQQQQGGQQQLQQLRVKPQVQLPNQQQQFHNQQQQLPNQEQQLPNQQQQFHNQEQQLPNQQKQFRYQEQQLPNQQKQFRNQEQQLPNQQKQFRYQEQQLPNQQQQFRNQEQQLPNQQPQLLNQEQQLSNQQQQLPVEQRQQPVQQQQQKQQLHLKQQQLNQQPEPLVDKPPTYPKVEEKKVRDGLPENQRFAGADDFFMKQSSAKDGNVHGNMRFNRHQDNRMNLNFNRKKPYGQNFQEPILFNKKPIEHTGLNRGGPDFGVNERHDGDWNDPVLINRQVPPFDQGNRQAGNQPFLQNDQMRPLGNVHQVPVDRHDQNKELPRADDSKSVQAGLNQFRAGQGDAFDKPAVKVNGEEADRNVVEEDSKKTIVNQDVPRKKSHKGRKKQTGIELQPQDQDEHILRRKLLSNENYQRRKTNNESVLTKFSYLNVTRRLDVFSTKHDTPVDSKMYPAKMRITAGNGDDSMRKTQPETTGEELLKKKKREDAVALDDVTEQEVEKIVEDADRFIRENSFLPWERTEAFVKILKEEKKQERLSDYQASTFRGRKTLDTFADSLIHVNRLYNKRFGFISRKVPGHIPHMIDIDIMSELQSEFPVQFDATSSHQIRHAKDMQFAFSYMYYIIGSPKAVNTNEIFDEFDTDHSGVLSDRELRTLATRLFDLPLDLQTLSSLENSFIQCAKNLSKEIYEDPMLKPEKYYEEKMPQVTAALVAKCPAVTDLMKQSVKGQTNYQHEVMGDEEIAFKMIRTNVSQVIGQLDDIRKNPKKFVCLNDNIEHSNPDANMVKAVLQDFYEALFPLVSQFELPRDYRNRFLHVDELREWRRYRDWLRFWTQLSLSALVTFSVASFCSRQLMSIKRKCCPRRRTKASEIAEKVQHV